MSQREFFISSKFDKDGDGKLNETEKRAAVDALNNGYERRFLFGLDRKMRSQAEGNSTQQAFNRIV